MSLPKDGPKPCKILKMKEISDPVAARIDSIIQYIEDTEIDDFYLNIAYQKALELKYFYDQFIISWVSDESDPTKTQ